MIKAYTTKKNAPAVESPKLSAYIDKNLYIYKLKEINLKNVNLKIILKKSNYEPVEISFTSESFNTSSENKITNVEAKRTFSNINNTKVEKPEGIQ